MSVQRYEQETIEQLTLDVGGENAKPMGASFKVSGKMCVAKELKKDEQVVVTITNADGEVVCAGEGFVRGVNFLTHRPKDLPTWTERVHTVKLD